MSLSQLLTQRRDDIVAAFVRELEREQPPADEVPRYRLVDHIPELLDEISADLSRTAGVPRNQPAAQVKDAARQHGEQRWQLGFDLTSVVTEYGILLQVVLDAARSAGVLPNLDEIDSLTRYINAGIAEATAEYTRWREEERNSRQADLQFLSEAAELLGSSLDYRSTLARLTRLIVPRLADLCVVNLDGSSVDETPIAHVDPSKLAVMRDVLHGFSAHPGPPGHAEVTRSGEAVLFESAPVGHLERLATSPEHLASLKAVAASSWIVVPLKLQSGTFGSITLAYSESGKHYGRTDLLLAEELAHKAATAIDNARLYETSRSERARAEAAVRAKDEFVAMVSHELRTPLNVILGWVRLLRSGGLSDATTQRALEVIERNANAQSQLVGDLLDISRAMTGKIRLDPAQVDIAGLLNLVLEDAHFALETKRIRLHAALPEAGLLMRGDADRLKQTFWNLLLNAIKFTPKGGEIWATLRSVESDIELSIRDNGIGVAPEFLPHIFDSFRQSDSRATRAHGGLGIGLSIAKHLVELHGGSIEALSEGLGKGAELVVRLPVSPLISATRGVTRALAATPERQPLVRPDVLATMSVLVVDDEEDARDLLRIVLESCDATVHVAANVPEALAALSGQHVNLIVSDIGMPEQDGCDLIRAVRALPDPAKASVPAIALTAFAQPEDRTRALVAGFNVYMSKPVELEELLMALADLVRHAPPKSSL